MEAFRTTKSKSFHLLMMDSLGPLNTQANPRLNEPKRNQKIGYAMDKSNFPLKVLGEPVIPIAGTDLKEW
jgi:hypothetical protein